MTSQAPHMYRGETRPSGSNHYPPFSTEESSLPLDESRLGVYWNLYLKLGGSNCRAY